MGIDKVSACTKACNDDPNKPCFPLQNVKDAAKAFVDQMYSGYDRVAVVSYARASESAYTLGTDLNAAKVAIDGLRAFDNGGVVCSFLGTAPWKCGSSNPGGAMKRAAWELSGKPNDIREDSLWVTVFLSSGGMNATDPIPSSDPESAEWGFCPAKDPANDPANQPPLVPLVIQDRMFDTAGQLFFTMDFCEGEPLKSVILRERFLTGKSRNVAEDRD